VTAAQTITLAGCLAALSCARPAWAQGEWLLIDRDLGQRRVELTQLRDGELSFLDEAGVVRTHPASGFLAAIHQPPPRDRPARELPWISRQMLQFGRDPRTESAPEPFVGVLELTDGQRWVGAMVSARDDTITWLVEDTLVLDAPLDSIRSAALGAALDDARATWHALDDRLLLTNGDTLDGFVGRFGPVVRLEQDGRETDLDLGRVAGMLLANPATAPAGTILRTRGGSVLAVEALEITVTGQVSARADARAPVGGLGLRTSELRSIDFAPGEFVGLASIAPAGVSVPGGQARATPPVVYADAELGIDSLELQGPIRVEWALPRPATRFAATATLPPAMWAWGDCEVVVLTADGREALRERLNADRPTAEINVPLGGLSGLTIEIESGRGGPVQDRVVLERPMVGWRARPGLSAPSPTPAPAPSGSH